MFRVFAASAVTLGLAAGAVPSFAQVTYIDDIDAAIPDNGCTDDANGTGGGGGTRKIGVPDGGRITDVDVEIGVFHFYRADLQVGLAYTPDAGAEISAVVLANGHDESGDGYFATFDSDAGSLCSAAASCGNPANCATQPPDTHCRPNQSLNAFDGASAPGTFTLTVCDRAAQDTGTLGNWSVVVSGVALTLDVDGNGVVGPLTDSLIILRYNFGFRGAALITGAVAGDCTRCSAADIEVYLAEI